MHNFAQYGTSNYRLFKKLNIDCYANITDMLKSKQIEKTLHFMDNTEMT